MDFKYETLQTCSQTNGVVVVIDVIPPLFSYSRQRNKGSCQPGTGNRSLNDHKTILSYIESGE